MHHGDPHACSIDFVGRFQWLAGAADIAIVDLHEDVAEGEVLGAGGIATSEPDVLFVGYPSEGRFGPAARFVLGADFAANRAAGSLRS